MPAPAGEPINDPDIATLKSHLLSCGLSVAQLVRTAWASASTYRVTDKRGGANGARLRLAPQKYWAVNGPAELPDILSKLEQVQADFRHTSGGRAVSMADLIVLGGCAAVEKAASDAGHNVQVPFTPGRTDATAEMTDVDAFAVLEPKADGFRNYLGNHPSRSPEELLVDRSALLGLTAPEMTVLVGGLRVLGANADGASYGVFTDRPETLTHDFFTQPRRPRHRLAARRISKRQRQRSTKAATARRAPPAGPRRESTWSSGPTRSCGRWPRSTPVTTRGRSSSTILWPPWNKVMMLDRFDLNPNDNRFRC